MDLSQKVKGAVSDIKTYWKVPKLGRYMTFKEIAAYAGGGIGAYFIITLGSTLLVTTQNMVVGGAIGVSPTDMYILYLISTLANIPLTGIRANIIDNTRGKGGKYRPYILSMGIPTALIAIAYVWFPYEAMYNLFPNMLFGKEAGYVIKCAMVLLFSLLLQFFFNFFNDAYTNLIHVLSPNTQERTDVLAIKSVVYSLAPSIVNIVLPIIAQVVSNDDLYDIRVYRYSYPYSHSSVSLLQLSFMQIPRKKSYRLKHIQFKSALWTHSVRLQRISISGLSLAQAGSASWRVLTAQSSSGHIHTVIPVTVLHTHLSVRLPVTPPFGECCLLRSVSENGVRKRYLSA